MLKKKIYAILISFLFSVILWISISLSSDYYATFDVPVNLLDFPPGYSNGSPLPQSVSIKVKGKGWKLLSLYLNTTSDFTIPIRYEYGKHFVNLFSYISDNPWLTNDVEVVSISPDTLSFFIEKSYTKKVQILPNVILEFKNGYGLASRIGTIPESTIVYGPYSYLKNIDTIKTNLLELSDLETKKVVQINLEKIPGMQYQNKNVKVILDVQKIVDRNFENLKVKVINTPSNVNIMLLPNKITVGLRGGVDILGKVDTSQIKAIINYKDIIADSLDSLSPQIICPENTTLIFTNPLRLRYILKKFNK